MPRAEIIDTVDESDQDGPDSDPGLVVSCGPAALAPRPAPCTAGLTATELFDRLLEIVKTRFGFPGFRRLQAEIMIALLHGRDLTAFLPTSAGKSLCFQVPALLAKRPVVICSPLLSLITDQVEALNKKSVAAGLPDCAVSLAGAHFTASNEDAAMAGRFDLIYVTPERLVTPAFIEKLRGLHSNVGILGIIIDEAHLVSSHGHDFRPGIPCPSWSLLHSAMSLVLIVAVLTCADMMEIGKVRLAIPEIPMACFTATATQAVKRDLASVLHLRNPQVFSMSQDRKNLAMRVAQVFSKQEALEMIVDECRDAENGSHVVFTFTRKDAVEFGEHLQSKLPYKRVLHYHGQMEMKDRLDIQKKFMENTVDVVCATGSSFGTGVDKNDIRKVLIWSAPKSMEDFVQQVGRGGRDGLPYQAVLIYTAASFAIHWSQQKKESSDLPAPTSRARKNSLWSLQNFCRSTSCRRRDLLKFWNEFPEWDKCGACDNCTGKTYKSTAPVPDKKKVPARARVQN